MIPFIDLNSQQMRIEQNVKTAINNVLAHGAYVMGPEVFELEKQLSSFSGAKHVISCSSGTDALSLILMAKGVKAGDAVLVPTFTFTATGEAVSLTGATPVFVDVDEKTFNMDINSLEKSYEKAISEGLNVAGVIAVDLFGQPADYDVIDSFCKNKKMWVLADAAQSFGASYKGRKVGTLGDATATSFFPAKPLGCYGDGGAVFTDDDELAEIIKSIRIHGQGVDKYENVRIGLNARLDSIQAAVLLEKLNIFPEEIEARQKLADSYNKAFGKFFETPKLLEGCTSVWAQYTLKVLPNQREDLVASLKEAGVPTAVYYKIPMHLQSAYKHYPRASENLSSSEKLSYEVLSLPMHPYMKNEDLQVIIDAVENFMTTASQESLSA